MLQWTSPNRNYISANGLTTITFFSSTFQCCLRLCRVFSTLLCWSRAMSEKQRSKTKPKRIRVNRIYRKWMAIFCVPSNATKKPKQRVSNIFHTVSVFCFHLRLDFPSQHIKYIGCLGAQFIRLVNVFIVSFVFFEKKNLMKLCVLRRWWS